jgi:hypothetical protein
MDGIRAPVSVDTAESKPRLYTTCGFPSSRRAGAEALDPPRRSKLPPLDPRQLDNDQGKAADLKQAPERR